MTPPFRMLDDATGEVATGPNGEKWEGIDIPPGHKMELYDTTSTDGSPWTRVSPSEIVRADEGVPPVDPPPIDPPPVDPPPVDPPPVDPPPVGDIKMVGLPKPTTTAELQAIIDDAANNHYVAVLAPNTVVDIDKTIIMRQTNHGGERWGLDGSWAKFNWVGPGGQDVFRAEGVTGNPNRGFTFMNCEIFGNGYAGNPARACLAIICPAGDDSAYYKLTLQNIFTSYAEVGFWIEGAVFEFSHINCHAENHRSHGMMAVTSEYEGGASVMSNCFGIAPNMSRNGGSGIYTSYSHNIEHGSFINNNRYGIEAPGGVRVAVFNNGENTGESLIKIAEWEGPGSLIYGNEMSCGGMAVANFGLPSTGLSMYVLDAPQGSPNTPSNEQTMENRVTAYHNGVGLDVRVRK